MFPGAIEEIEYAYDHLGAPLLLGRATTISTTAISVTAITIRCGSCCRIWTSRSARMSSWGVNAPSEGSERFFTFTEWHTIVHPFETMSSVVSMISHGVYERFPRLRVAYMEAGCGWLPSWLHRLDEHLELAGEREFPELTMSATDYFRRNCWISAECEDPFVADVIRWMGDDHIVYETDFPHPDSKYPHATSTFLVTAAGPDFDGQQAQGAVGQRG